MQKFEWAFFVIGSDWFDIAAGQRFLYGALPQPAG